MHSVTFFLALRASFVLSDVSSFDCPMRSQLLGYAALQQPARPASSLQEIADALNGDDDGRKSPNCTVTVPPSLSAGRPSSRFGVFALPTAGSSWFVSPSGSDAAAGTESAPFATIARAITASRASGGGGTVVLRAGTHYLLDTLALGVADSGLTLQAFPGEDAWVSGGIPLAGTNWVPWNVTDTWATHPGVVIDDGCGANCVVLAKTENASACAALIVSRGNTFSAYTWHSPSSSHGHANECVARNDSVWAPVSDSSSTSGRHTFSNVWAANLSAVDLRGGYVAGLRAGPSLRRLIRARYPNADPEFGFGPFLQSKSWTPPPAHALHPDIDYNPSVPNRTGQSRNFGTYKEGIGGGCAELLGGLAPPTGYWCSNTSEQTGMWRTPIGVDVDSESLPNQPYADPIGGVIQAWHPKRWASRMYNISSYSFSAAKGSGSFSFDRGGWQDARGSPDAGDFYVENVLEELDAPGEWFFMRNGTLLVYWNASGPPDSSVVAVSSSIRVLVNATGSQDAPVRNVSVLGLGFRDAAFSYFEEHSMPSAGDWTLARTAALFFEGSEATTIAGCVFERLDGCAVMASGYTRAANISDNEFAWVGDTAIALWGRTTGDPVGLDGPDGTDGNQPRGSLVSRNFAHELGIWEKQSSLLFQAKTSDTIAEGNIFFNGPRAAINLNDGFGGGNFISRNVLFNTCR